MRLQVLRKWFTEHSTVGELHIDGKFWCFTLEDRVRPPGEKVAGKTAIPPGRYKLVIDFSQRFQKPMPHVLDVPGFAGIRIHAGNTAADTEGCLLVGIARQSEKVLNSRLAYDNLLTELSPAVDKEGWVPIEYVNVNPPPHLVTPTNA